jgi:2-alkyl-3-oxoalkanoate reductase
VRHGSIDGSGAPARLRVFVTGASGVLGRALLPLLEAAGHHVRAPDRHELDLFEARSVGEALLEIEAVYHLATRIPPRQRRGDPDAWRENDRLRADAARLLVDAALVAGTEVYVQPSVTFVYPADGEVDEDSALRDVPPHLESSLASEREAARFAQAGRRGVVLRLGQLDGPGTEYAEPEPAASATLHVDDAGPALLSALDAPSGIYNVIRDGGRVSNERFKRATGWRPTR